MSAIRLTAAIAVAALALPAPAAAAAAAPETTITAGPSGPTNDGEPSFSFASDQPGSTFSCRLDGGIWTPRAPLGAAVPLHVLDPRWEPCSSPWAYENVEDGPHAFEVRASNPAGETDPTPATREFVVDADVEAAVVARATQRQPRRRVRVRLAIRAREALAATVAGTVTVERPSGDRRARHSLAPLAADVAAGGAASLRLRPSKRAGRRIAAGLRDGRRADARLDVSLTDALGSSIVRRLTIRLTAPGRR